MTIKAKKVILIPGILISVVSACLGLETQQSNHLGWALLFAGTTFSACGALTLGIMFLQDTSNQHARRDSLLWFPIVSVLVMSLVTPLEYLYLEPILARNDYLQDIGLILFAGGLSFHLLILKAPNTGTTPKPVLSSVPGHLPRMIQWALRPGFASLALLALGLCVGYSSLIGLLMVFFLLLPGLILCMKAEDRKSQHYFPNQDRAV